MFGKENKWLLFLRGNAFIIAKKLAGHFEIHKSIIFVDKFKKMRKTERKIMFLGTIVN